MPLMASTPLNASTRGASGHAWAPCPLPAAPQRERTSGPACRAVSPGTPRLHPRPLAPIIRVCITSRHGAIDTESRCHAHSTRPGQAERPPGWPDTRPPRHDGPRPAYVWALSRWDSSSAHAAARCSSVCPPGQRRSLGAESGELVLREEASPVCHSYHRTAPCRSPHGTARQRLPPVRGGTALAWGILCRSAPVPPGEDGRVLCATEPSGASLPHCPPSCTHSGRPGTGDLVTLALASRRLPSNGPSLMRLCLPGPFSPAPVCLSCSVSAESR